MKKMEFQKKYLLWRMDFSEPLRIPDFRVLETVETGETYAIPIISPPEMHSFQITLYN